MFFFFFLAICCDVGAANYVETSAMASEVSEAFEVAGLAYMKTLQRYSTNSSHHSTTSGTKFQRKHLI